MNEDKTYYATKSRKPLPFTLRCIREAKKIHLTSLTNRNGIYRFEENPASTRVSTVERYISELGIEIILDIAHVGEYNCIKFSEGLLYAVKMRDVSLRDISRKTGISKSQVKKHINGYVGMHVYQLELYCKVLRVKIGFRNIIK